MGSDKGINIPKSFQRLMIEKSFPNTFASKINCTIHFVFCLTIARVQFSRRGIVSILCYNDQYLSFKRLYLL